MFSQSFVICKYLRQFILLEQTEALDQLSQSTAGGNKGLIGWQQEKQAALQSCVTVSHAPGGNT